jgi:hypothetical protein
VATNEFLVQLLVVLLWFLEQWRKPPIELNTYSAGRLALR